MCVYPSLAAQPATGVKGRKLSREEEVERRGECRVGLLKRVIWGGYHRELVFPLVRGLALRDQDSRRDELGTSRIVFENVLSL